MSSFLSGQSVKHSGLSIWFLLHWYWKILSERIFYPSGNWSCCSKYWSRKILRMRQTEKLWLTQCVCWGAGGGQPANSLAELTSSKFPLTLPGTPQIFFDRRLFLIQKSPNDLEMGIYWSINLKFWNSSLEFWYVYLYYHHHHHHQ